MPMRITHPTLLTRKGNLSTNFRAQKVIADHQTRKATEKRKHF